MRSMDPNYWGYTKAGVEEGERHHLPRRHHLRLVDKKWYSHTDRAHLARSPMEYMLSYNHPLMVAELELRHQCLSRNLPPACRRYSTNSRWQNQNSSMLGTRQSLDL